MPVRETGTTEVIGTEEKPVDMADTIQADPRPIADIIQGITDELNRRQSEKDRCDMMGRMVMGG